MHDIIGDAFSRALMDRHSDLELCGQDGWEILISAFGRNPKREEIIAFTARHIKIMTKTARRHLGRNKLTEDDVIHCMQEVKWAIGTA